ncbi:MAG: hypothetical protein H6686_11610 [Fibrobacteria bacterium]|nr:hypothetical protein [Fibrobacteria bacterium]
MNPAVTAALSDLHRSHATAREELLDLVASRGLAHDVTIEDLRESSGPFLTALRQSANAAAGAEPELHVVLQGPAGVGKTHLAQSLRQALGGEAGVRIMRGSTADGAGSIVAWIVRDGIRPEGVPPGTPVIRVRGLSSQEKRVLLVDRLVPRIAQAHGIDAKVVLQQEILACLLRGGDHEAGLKGAILRLERICRRWSRELMEGRARGIDQAWLHRVLGTESSPIDAPAPSLPPGSVHAPMVSSLGGAIARVEVFASSGRGRLLLTGAGPQAEVACKVARTRLLALAGQLAMPTESLRDMDWHIHVAGPAGPKDGASLGWPVLVAMVSFLSMEPVDARFGFTGELLLSGELASVGFVEEKFLACEREGFSRLWIPSGNGEEIPTDPILRGGTDVVVSCRDLEALHSLGLIQGSMV